MRTLKNIVLLLFLLPAVVVLGQKKKKKKKDFPAEFGFQIKPIIPVNYFGAGEQTFSDSVVDLSLNSKAGMSFGVLIRKKITSKIAVETGISQIKRNYIMKGKGTKYGTSDEGSFGYVSYQIPVQGLFYIQLAEKIFMNTTAGVGVDMYPSSITSKGDKYLMQQLTLRQHWISFSMLANLGVEYRTETKGTIYFGFSFNKPFSPIGETTFKYFYKENQSTKTTTFLNGNYLTIDLRFFFPENKEEK